MQDLILDIKQQQIPSEEQKIVLRTFAESVARKNCKFLEVGSWCGDSSIILENVVKKYDGYLFCVDWWKGNIGTELQEIASKVDVFTFFWNRICNEGLKDVIIPIRALSNVVSEILREETFDLIFLDGDHRYEGILSDIQHYLPLVKRNGGILCGHDCEGHISDFEPNFLESGKDVDIYEGIHCGVVLAVGSIFKEYSINCGIWSVKATDNDSGWKPTNLEFPEIEVPFTAPPVLLGSYKGYNLIRYGCHIHAVSQALGPLDLQRIEKYKLKEYQNISMYAVGSSVDKTKQFIDQYNLSLGQELYSIEDPQGIIKRRWISLKRKFIDYGLQYKETIKKIPLVGSLAKKIYYYLKER